MGWILDLGTGHEHVLSARQFGQVCFVHYSLTPNGNLEVRRYSHLTSEETQTAWATFPRS